MTGFGAGFPLSQMSYLGVQQNFSFFSATLFAPAAHLYFEISILQGRKQVFEIVFSKNHSLLGTAKSGAIATLFRKRGQSLISASNSSPA